MNFNTAQRNQLESFLGYGNLKAPIWFLGMEEGTGDADEARNRENLRQRVQYFTPVMDIVKAHNLFGHDITKQTRFTQVWVWMAKFVRALNGANDWKDVSQAKDYIRQRLGRADGETLLLELMPLPAPSIKAWPYAEWYKDRKVYRETLLSKRIETLREMVSDCKPAYVFAYGSTNYPYYRQLVSSEMKLLPNTKRAIEIQITGKTQIILLPFFGNGRLTTSDATLLIDYLRMEHR